MRFLGRQTVVFVTVTEDLNTRDRYGNPAIIRTETPISGCRFRPLTAKEKVEQGFNSIEDPWRATCPPVATVMNAKSNDEVKVDGVTYQITGGPRVFPDLQGSPFKVTVICERRA